MKRMNTRTEVIKELQSSKNYLSGEELANRLNTSRTSIWKNIQKLRDAGYSIESKRGVGYRLLRTPNKLLPSELLPLDVDIVGREIIHFEEIGSTNSKMKEKSGEKEGLIIIAERQTKGRGRLDRDWESPSGGIWMSVLLKPSIHPVKTPLLTMISSLSVHESLEGLGIEGSIKWPNDVLVDGKKICGVLTEIDAEAEVLNYAIVGIGLNVNFEAKEIPYNNLTTVKAELGRKVDRKALIKSIILNLDKWYKELKNNLHEEILNTWRKNSYHLGKEVKVKTMSGEVFSGIAKDFSETGGLVVEEKDGTKRTLFAGDVTLI